MVVVSAILAEHGIPGLFHVHDGRRAPGIGM